MTFEQNLFLTLSLIIVTVVLHSVSMTLVTLAIGLIVRLPLRSTTRHLYSAAFEFRITETVGSRQYSVAVQQAPTAQHKELAWEGTSV